MRERRYNRLLQRTPFSHTVCLLIPALTPQNCVMLFPVTPQYVQALQAWPFNLPRIPKQTHNCKRDQRAEITNRDKDSREKQMLMLLSVCVSACISTVVNPLTVTSFEQSANYHILFHLGLNNCHTTPPPTAIVATRIHGNSVKQGTMVTATVFGGWWEMMFRLRKTSYLILWV